MSRSRVLVDSSWLIAQYDTGSRAYKEIREISRLYQGQFLVPQVALTEVIYLVKREAGLYGVAQFLHHFNNSQPDLQEVSVADLHRVREIVQQYTTANFDFVDCCIMALAERLGITQIAMLDRRDFSIFRPRHISHFELLL